MKQDDILQRLFALAEPVCADAGYCLVDVEHKQSPQGWVVRVYIDVPEGATGKISFADCERVSHELSAILDVEDVISHAYHLEVSSPGLDRPLRKSSDFQRFIGHEAKISLRTGVDGRRNYRGYLTGVSDDGSLVTIAVDGTDMTLPLADLSSARLVPDWNSLMNRE